MVSSTSFEVQHYLPLSIPETIAFGSQETDMILRNLPSLTQERNCFQV